MYFTGQKCQIFNNSIYDKTICYGQNDAELIMLEVSVTDKLEE